MIDGLALPGFADCLAAEAQRLRLSVSSIIPVRKPDRSKSAYAALEARLWALLKGILCPSDNTAKAVIASGVAAHRVVVAIPGTDRPRLTGERKPNGPLRLLAVGTITPRKGHLLLVEALAGLTDYDW